MHVERRKTIHEAMVRLADGDRSAMPGLVKELWPVLIDFARRGVPQEHDVEDIAQEVFLRICTRVSEFDPRRDGLSWAFGIASYEILTHRRKLLRRREAFDASELDQHADARASQEEAAIQQELDAALAQVLGATSEEDRIHLGLAATAAANAASPTFRKRRQRALERLRSAWRRLYGEP